MLQKMHDKSGSFVIKVILTIIGASFVVFGLADVVRIITATPPVAKIGRERISLQEFYPVYQKQMQRLRKTYGDKVSQQELKKLPITLVEEMINQRVLDMEPAKLGLRVPRAFVSNFVTTMPAFQRNGEFDVDLFHQSLRYAGIRQGDLIANLSSQLLQQQLIAPLTEKANLSSFYRDLLLNTIDEKKTFQLVIAPNNFKIAEPTEKDLEHYLDEHEDKYRVAEKRSFDLYWLDHALLKSSIEVSDAEITEAFQEHRSMWDIPAQRVVYAVKCANESDAKITKKLLMQLQGERQKALQDKKKKVQKLELKKFFDKKLPGVEVEKIGNKSQSAFPAELGKSIFSLPAYGSFGPLKVEDQFIVFFVESVTPAVTKSLTDPKVKEEVIQIVRDHKLLNRLEEIKNDIEDSLAGNNAEEMFKKYPLSKKEVTLVSAQECAEQLGKLKVAESAYPTVQQTAFELDEGGESSFLDIPGASVVVHMNKIEKQHTPKLELIRAKVAADWKKAKIEKEGLAWGNRYFDHIDTDAQWEKAVKESRGTTEHISFSRMDLWDEAHPVYKYFENYRLGMLLLFQKGQIETCTMQDGRVATVRMIKTAPDSKGMLDNKKMAMKDEISKQLSSSFQTDLLQLMSTEIRENYKIKINKDVLKRIHNSSEND